jgi:hypothetical protein
MSKNTFAELQKYQKKIAALEKTMERERRKLAGLHSSLGFKSTEALIAALREVDQGGGSAPQAGGRRKVRQKRAKITPEVKARVRALVGQKKTGAEIARATGISLPSVANIKRELGLTRKK